ncbi:drug/metabolite transporter (DMT)-like permease [Ancylobacter sp. 3268]|uniref:DMT family transporter n=1 Tax=Ancylobacter sp. 3268 TaxID=2817752 RepID=UPI00285BCC13|nr:DMT family transporter [Ancylobacter sp. 3268]MDR6951868.1 drug/metabolite transporter (DMT)-like permease [Ancylobacter sp. 3268]
MLIGILAGLATGALWGLSFVAPRAVVPFTALELSAARYLLFGVVCVLLMADARFRPTGLSHRQKLMGFALGAFGYFGYFLAISYAVLLAGAVVPPLIAGTAPVVLAVIGNLRERAVAWRRLAAPLGLIAAGLAVVNAAGLGQAPPDDALAMLAGIGLSVVALAVWVVYGLANAMVMRTDGAPSALRWTGLQGLGAGTAAVLLLPVVLRAPTLPAEPEDAMRFLVWVLLMGGVVSWFGTYCWMVASRQLPLALSAQLIVAETVFGLGYGLAYEQRLPNSAEAVGTLLQLVGVVLAVTIFTRRGREAERPITPEPGIP